MLADGPYLNAGRTVPGKLLNVTSPAPGAFLSAPSGIILASLGHTCPPRAARSPEIQQALNRCTAPRAEARRKAAIMIIRK
jgi:hypothetical protein